MYIKVAKIHIEENGISWYLISIVFAIREKKKKIVNGLNGSKW